MTTAFTVKSPDDIRDDILRTLENGLRDRGVEAPNVGAGSDWYVLATALANQLAVVAANTQIKADAMMPDSAIGDDLERLCAVYGLSRKSAAGASGSVTFSTSTPAGISTSQQLVDAYGQRYAVSTAGTYNNGDAIPIKGVDTGDATNRGAGEVLRWISPPTGAASTVIVGTLTGGLYQGALVGGMDEEDDETLRARLYARLRTPPGSGNWQHVAEIAEASSTLVQKAFVYPAVNGPATYAVAVVGATTSSSKSRQVDGAEVTNTIAPYVRGQMPEYAEGYITTVIDQPIDVAVGLALPAAPTASPPGPGGGWVDGTPWPANPDSPDTFVCTVGTVTTTQNFLVDAPTPPTDGLTQIAYVDDSTWTLYTAKVESATGTSGAYLLKIDKAFPNIAEGDYVFPLAANTQVYVDALLAAFAAMGPGEKVAKDSAAYRRGYRHPLPAQAWPYTLGPVQMRALTDATDEVLEAQINAATATTPTLAADAKSAPHILIPRRIGFYPL